MEECFGFVVDLTHKATLLPDCRESNPGVCKSVVASGLIWRAWLNGSVFPKLVWIFHLAGTKVCRLDSVSFKASSALRSGVSYFNVIFIFIFIFMVNLKRSIGAMLRGLPDMYRAEVKYILAPGSGRNRNQ